MPLVPGEGIEVDRLLQVRHFPGSIDREKLRLQELRNGLVDLTAAKIQVAQRVGSIPVGGLVLDDRAVLRDGQIELPLAEQFLRFAERSLAIKWHRQRSRK